MLLKTAYCIDDQDVTSEYASVDGQDVDSDRTRRASSTEWSIELIVMLYAGGIGGI